MTKQEIHEVLCSMPDKEKMKLCVLCQLNSISVEELEELVVNTVTVAQTLLAPAIRDYEYLRGGQ